MLRQPCGPGSLLRCPADVSRSAALGRHKYLLVIDGNAATSRLYPFLCSSSLVFLVEGMSEWFHAWLRPWEHYVPVALDFSDLEKNVQWAVDHDEEAQAIVRRANEVMTKHTRDADQQCYW